MSRLLSVALAAGILSLLLGCSSSRPEAEAAYERGRVLLGEERLEEASAAFEEAIRLDPDFAPSYNGRGLVLDARQDPEAALKAFDRCLELDPDFWKARMNRGDLLARLRRFEEARADLDRALELAPEEANGWATRARLLCTGFQRPDLALADLDRARRLDPESAYVREIRLVALMQLARMPEALAEAEVLLSADPGHWVAGTNRAQMLLALGRDREALEELKRALRGGKMTPLAHTTFSQAWLAVGRPDQALRALSGLEPWLTEAPPDLRVGLLTQRGAALAATGQLEGAVADLREALRLRPGAALPRAELGLALIRSGRKAEGRKELEGALASWPGDIPLAPDAPAAVVEEVRERVRAAPSIRRLEERVRSALRD